MKPLTLTAFVASKLNSVGGSRGYPRLTAPDRRKTRLNAPNRAKNFSGGSRASIRGSARNRTNSHQLAHLAPTCRKKNYHFLTLRSPRRSTIIHQPSAAVVLTLPVSSVPPW